MKIQLKMSLFIALVAFLSFTSCTTNEVTSLTLSSTTSNFIIGQTDSLVATVTASGDISKFPVDWSTTDASIVSVTNGKITGLSGGKATITAKSGDITATCDVTVNNEITAVMNVGYLAYYGDSFESGLSNFFMIGIAGTSDTLYFSINVPLTATDSLPVGNYSVITSLNSEADLVPFSVIPGELYKGLKYFSWYFGKIESPVVEGNFNVTSFTDGIYTIELNLIDGFGNTIYASFQGSLNYYDESLTASSSVSAATKSLSKIPKFGLLQNRKQFESRLYLN